MIIICHRPLFIYNLWHYIPHLKHITRRGTGILLRCASQNPVSWVVITIMANTKQLSISILVVIVSFIASYYHAIYTGDIIGNFVGYFASMAILPVFLGISIGCLGIYALKNHLGSYLKHYWWLPAIGAISSLAPTAIYIMGMSMEHS